MKDAIDPVRSRETRRRHLTPHNSCTHPILTASMPPYPTQMGAISLLTSTFTVEFHARVTQSFAFTVLLTSFAVLTTHSPYLPTTIQTGNHTDFVTGFAAQNSTSNISLRQLGESRRLSRYDLILFSSRLRQLCGEATDSFYRSPFSTSTTKAIWGYQ